MIKAMPYRLKVLALLVFKLHHHYFFRECRLQIRSKPGWGTVVYIEIPFVLDQDQALSNNFNQPLN
jgi:hypothetical protein